MRKALIVTQILLGLALLGFLVYRFFFQSVPPLLHDPSTWKNWEGYYAISYTGITKEETGAYLTREGLDDHLSSLKEAGFVPIAPEDVVAFYRESRPLPAKGILILFEGGRKDSFFLGTPLLRKYGFLATMAVPTALVEERDPFYLKKGDLKKLQASPYWRLASMGHEAYKSLRDYRGRPGHFLSARIVSGAAPEDDRAFQERIRRDYRKAASFLSGIAGKPVITYLYPFADAGLSPEADPLAAAINRQAVKEVHAIAFVGAHSPFNGPQEDPYRLTRLRVPPSWNGKQLIRELEKHTPRISPVDGTKELGIWQSDKPLHTEEGLLKLPADSLHWVRGTEGWRDQEVHLKITLPPQAVTHLFLRYQDRNDHLVLTLTAQEAALRERQKGYLQGLATISLSKATNGSGRFRILLKADRAWCWQDKHLLFGPLPLFSRNGRGKLGLAVRGTEVFLSDFQARPLNGYYVSAASYETFPATLKTDIQVIMLPWPDGSPAFFAAEKRKIDVLKAASEGVQTVPLLTLSPGASPEDRERLVASVQKTLSDPLLKPFIRTLALSGADKDWVSHFQKAGFQVIQLIQPEETEKILREPGEPTAERILLKGPPEAVRQALNRLLYRVPASRIIASVAPGDKLPPGVHPAFFREQEGRGE